MDSKRLKVKIIVSMQLQRTINDTRRWISVLSSETICHLKKLNTSICFINTQMLACFRCASQTLAEVPSQCLQVERANTKSNAVYKKGSYNLTSLQGKTTTSDDFELRRRRWDGAYVKRDLFNVITCRDRPIYISRYLSILPLSDIKKNKKKETKLLIVSLDKTLIHHLVSYIVLWSCTETVILTFNRYFLLWFFFC